MADDGTGGASAAEARACAAAVQSLLAWVHAPENGERNEVAALVREVLGEAGEAESVVTRQLPPFEQVNLQTALDAWSTEPGRRVEVRGVAMPPHYGRLTLQQLVSGEALPPLRPSAPGVVDLPNGPGSTLACLRLALLLVTDARGRYVLLVAAPEEHEPVLSVEVAGLPVREAQAVLAELDRESRRLNVYRGQVVEVALTPMGMVSLTFLDRPTTGRDEVVLPEPVLTGSSGTPSPSP